ncbi:hypothetical protein [Methanothrix sp.]|uniref:hypothetical protein n=1 Tax=Methanothrix sp. TaxID=90426 RepID=UPI003BB518F6
MKHVIFLICILAISLPLSAFAADTGYSNPNIGQSYGRGTLDEGLAGMLDWLDQPVPSSKYPLPSDPSLYAAGAAESAFTPYSEYFAAATKAAESGVIGAPAQYDISGKEPIAVYYGDGQGLEYPQYASAMASRSDLWIKGTTNWSQYAVVPLGSRLELVAYVPQGGDAGFYQTIQTGSIFHDYGTYQLDPGYSNMSFDADQAGRHMLYFVINNQPSNVVIVDVFPPQAEAASSKPSHAVS